MSKYPDVPDYKRDMEIDQFNLELECIRHARITTDYTDLLAQAIFDRDKAKEALEVNEAQLDQSIRSVAAQAQEKVTEAVVKNRLTVDPTHQEAVKLLIETEYVVNVLKGAVRGCDKKGDRLSDLIKLFGMKYYAEPYQPPGSEVKAQGLAQGRLEATKALSKWDKNKPPSFPKSNQEGPESKADFGLKHERDEQGYRYAIGQIESPDCRVFIHGPFPYLKQALSIDATSGPLTGLGIYRLTRDKPDQLIYIWHGKGWVEKENPVAEAPLVRSPGLSPRPPLPKRS